MRTISCPICNKRLMSVPDDVFIDFDLRVADEKIFCLNCKRKIRYSQKERIKKERDYVTVSESKNTAEKE